VYVPCVPKIGVVVPCFNRRELVAQTLRSVLYQDGGDSFVIVVVDDGSTDDTLPFLLDTFAAHIARVEDRIVGQSTALNPQQPIVVIRQRNMHIAGARNTGLREALHLGCRYLTHQDSDDLSLPHKHRVLAGFLDAHPSVGMVHAQSQDMSFDGFLYPEGAGPFESTYRLPRPGGSFVERAARGDFQVGELRAENYVHNQTTMYTRAAVEALGDDHWFPDLPYGEDWQFYLRLEGAGIRFGFVPTYVSVTRAHIGGLSGTRPDTQTLALAIAEAAAETMQTKKADLYVRARAKWPHDFDAELQRSAAAGDFSALVARLCAQQRTLTRSGALPDALSLAHRVERLSPSPTGHASLVQLVDALVAQLSTADSSLELAKQIFALKPSQKHASALAQLLPSAPK
jgi:GT2 family glycosyltransferase